MSISEFTELRYETDNLLNNDLLSVRLTAVFNKYGKAIILKDDFITYLLNEKFEMKTAFQIGLIADLTDFKEYIKRKKVSYKSLQILIIKEVEYTCLNKALIYSYLIAIFKSLNLVDNADILSDFEGTHHVSSDSDEICAFPFSYYISDIKKLKKDEDLSNREIISFYANLGVPIAKFLMAKDMVNSDENCKGIILMKEASALGCGPASQYLGKWYYNKGYKYWGDALKYYSDFGNVTMDNEDKRKYINLLNYKEFNKVVLILGFVLAIICTVLLILIPFIAQSIGGIILYIISVLLQIIMILFGVIKYKKNCFYDSYKSILFAFIIWMIGFLIFVGL